MNYVLNDYTKSNFALLLKPFENSIEDVIKITKAFSLANKIHLNKFLDGNKQEPYINHPIRVALILSEELKLKDIDLIIAALLHDVFYEKYSNGIAFVDLKTLVGDNIGNIIKTVTVPKISNDEKLLNEYYQKISKSSKTIRYIITADRLDTIRFLKNKGYKEKSQRYKEETQKYIIPIADKTDDGICFKLSIALYELK